VAKTQPAQLTQAHVDEIYDRILCAEGILDALKLAAKADLQLGKVRDQLQDAKVLFDPDLTKTLLHSLDMHAGFLEVARANLACARARIDDAGIELLREVSRCA
jgi:hypothetical protein